MIKNKRQLRITKSQLNKFRHHLTSIEKVKERGNKLLLIKAEREAIKSQIKDLEDQVREYESLWSSRTPIPKLQSFENIPRALIKARLSLGLSQKEFAGLVGLKEQQIQRYESTDYETASLARIGQLIKVLNLQLSDSVQFPTEDITLRDFFKKMKKVGLDRDFVVTHLFPPWIRAKLQDSKDGMTIDNLGIQVIDHVGKIFGWTSREVIGHGPLSMDLTNLGNVRFKIRKGANMPRLTAYTFYTHYLALIVLQATNHLPLKPLPSDPYLIRKNILCTYGSFTLENALRYIWILGVPVVFLDDPGSFQGAHFHKIGRNVIILKQRMTSHSRSLFNLFHEFWHATQHREDAEHKSMKIEDFEYISSTGNRFDSEEEDASLFAGAVSLGRSPDNLVQMCINEAHHDLLKLKIAVQNVAIREKVPVDVLANCVAFRLSQEGVNWWGPAQNLQEPRNDIQQIAKAVLLDYVDLSQLSGFDLHLLRSALSLYEENEI